MSKTSTSDGDRYKEVQSELSRGGYVIADDKWTLSLVAYYPGITQGIPWEQKNYLSGPRNDGESGNYRTTPVGD